VRVRFVRQGATVHYGPAPVDGALWLPANPSIHGMLLARESLTPDARDTEFNGERFLSLFPVGTTIDAGDSPLHSLRSDIVSAAFFFLSRHEEWTCTEFDQFGRFRADAGLLGRRGELDRPVVREYAAVLACGLLSRGVELPRDERYAGHPAAAVMTHDIDYLSKFTPGLVFREVVKNFFFNRRHVNAAERRRRLWEYLQFHRRSRDPYVVSILRMLEIETASGITASWLFKTGGRDKRDVSYRLDSSRARMILRMIREKGHDIGLHPSFHAHDDLPMLQREKKRLDTAAAMQSRSVRQHYLRFRYPATWRNQVAAGFEVDSTLGHAEQEGFRGGTAHPFLPFDLEEGRVLPVWEVPLTVMDGTLAHYRGLDPVQAVERIRELLDLTAQVRGTAVLLFHNTAYDHHDFQGWGGVFEESCRMMSDGRFHTGALPSVVRSWLSSSGYESLPDVMKVINSEPA
ncbi:MAG: polysaccharide deacetylase family protein, partial [Bacteroidetes bacterium]|nr:polysaccharide deacetylase family protein [Bacteroidota bacterium]